MCKILRNVTMCCFFHLFLLGLKKLVQLSAISYKLGVLDEAGEEGHSVVSPSPTLRSTYTDMTALGKNNFIYISAMDISKRIFLKKPSFFMSFKTICTRSKIFLRIYFRLCKWGHTVCIKNF